MRSRPMRLAPASSAMPSIRPSTCLGTPEISRLGGGPRRSGQLRRTMSKFAPIPPLVTSTAPPRALNSPETSRELSSPRPASGADLAGDLAGAERAPAGRARLQHGSAHALDGVAAQQQLVDAVAE